MSKRANKSINFPNVLWLISILVLGYIGWMNLLPLLTLAIVMEHLQTFLKSQSLCLEKGPGKMGLLSGTADRGTD